MTQLWLNFTDPDNEQRRVAVSGGLFVIGRHSASDLCIPDSRLSREHVRIELFDGSFVVSDSGSSNGTRLNGSEVTSPTALRNGDTLDLGGLLVEVEIVADKPIEAPRQPSASKPNAPQVSVDAAAAEGSSIPMSLFIIAPLLGVLLLVFAGGIIYLLNSGIKPEITDNPDEEDPIVRVDKPGKGSDKEPSTDKPSPKAVDGPANNAPPTDPGNSLPGATPANLSETAKIEFNGAAFLRKIAQNNPKAFLTTEQAKRVSTKVKQLSSSTAIADNINSAKKNSDQIRALATAKNLKPQFLAVAAITKLGTNRGDVVAAAQSMADVLDKLRAQIGNELADDSLLMIAAYDQGAAGNTMKMRNMLQDLSNKFPESARVIRSIWFLQKQNKITSTEFDRALSFLAIGTITQNPKDFGVNAEALIL